MATPINGNNVLLYLRDPSDVDNHTMLVACGTSLTLNLNNDFFSISNMDAGFFKSLPTFTSGSIDSSQLFILDPDECHTGGDILTRWTLAKTRLEVIWAVGGFQLVSEGYISTFSVNGNYNAVTDCSISLKLSGRIHEQEDCDAPVLTITALPPATPGQTNYSVSFPFTGTIPVMLSGISKPSWLEIEVDCNDIKFSSNDVTNVIGTYDISFTLVNCGGETPVTTSIEVADSGLYSLNLNNDGASTLNVTDLKANGVTVSFPYPIIPGMSTGLGIAIGLPTSIVYSGTVSGIDLAVRAVLFINSVDTEAIPFTSSPNFSFAAVTISEGDLVEVRIEQFS